MFSVLKYLPQLPIDTYKRLSLLFLPKDKTFYSRNLLLQILSENNSVCTPYIAIGRNALTQLIIF